MDKIIDKYFELLWGFFLYDIEVFTEKWMYIPFLIPAAFYFMFFMLKWYVLLIPVTLPFSITMNILRPRRNKKSKKTNDPNIVYPNKIHGK